MDHMMLADLAKIGAILFFGIVLSAIVLCYIERTDPPHDDDEDDNHFNFTDY